VFGTREISLENRDTQVSRMNTVKGIVCELSTLYGLRMSLFVFGSYKSVLLMCA